VKVKGYESAENIRILPHDPAPLNSFNMIQQTITDFIPVENDAWSEARKAIAWAT
jgi:hypothetical protein